MNNNLPPNTLTNADGTPYMADGRASMNTIDHIRDIQHVQGTEQKNHDEFGRGLITFDAQVLTRLLFCDMYTIEEMRIEDEVLHLFVRYTGTSMPRETERALCWDYQQQQENRGVMQLHVVSLSK